MANDFYQHSGWPGTRALNASASWRSEFGLIEEGFDKLPDVSTANLFAVTDGSALVGKTAAQAKVILALDSVPNLDTTAAVAHTSLTNNPHSITKAQVGLGSADNTADADKPISTLTQAALDLKAPRASPSFTGTPVAPTPSLLDNDTSIATTAFLRNLFGSSTNSSAGYQYFPPASGHNRAILLQWGYASTHATQNTATAHSYGVAFDNFLNMVATAYTSSLIQVVSVYNHNATGFTSIANASSVNFRYFAVGYMNLT